ncbi:MULTISPECIES: septal ring lytic transglycosylase RlpA family protein [Bartonella]|uniref:septal ring lytic transglycosylase RlpA family protein n=1 Tax=Bartonella TaxID=773 RepID=UPI0018DCB27D|nr:septal ring lytic transglycosylase RlpA family protein [Bartonella choladocola]MBI0014245.1 septal ring lytic transglycosylase RlpA family protein [Bartonella sp. B10834G3]
MCFLTDKKRLLSFLTAIFVVCFSSFGNAALSHGHINHGGQCGGASWYALHSKTASGEKMNPFAMTAAHKTLPLGSKIRVTNKFNGKSIIVRINDRGPFITGRILDLSKGAASQLGFVQNGLTNVCYERLS